MPLNDRQNYTRPDGGIDEDILAKGKKSEFIGRRPFLSLNHPNYDRIFPRKREIAATVVDFAAFMDPNEAPFSVLHYDPNECPECGRVYEE